MEVASQYCDTVPNKTKDILGTVKIEKIFKHDSQVQHPVKSSVHGTDWLTGLTKNPILYPLASLVIRGSEDADRAGGFINRKCSIEISSGDFVTCGDHAYLF